MYWIFFCVPLVPTYQPHPFLLINPQKQFTGKTLPRCHTYVPWIKEVRVVLTIVWEWAEARSHWTMQTSTTRQGKKAVSNMTATRDTVSSEYHHYQECYNPLSYHAQVWSYYHGLFFISAQLVHFLYHFLLLLCIATIHAIYRYLTSLWLIWTTRTLVVTVSDSSDSHF